MELKRVGCTPRFQNDNFKLYLMELKPVSRFHTWTSYGLLIVPYGIETKL